MSKKPDPKQTEYSKGDAYRIEYNFHSKRWTLWSELDDGGIGDEDPICDYDTKKEARAGMLARIGEDNLRTARKIADFEVALILIGSIDAHEFDSFSSPTARHLRMAIKNLATFIK